MTLIASILSLTLSVETVSQLSPAAAAFVDACVDGRVAVAKLSPPIAFNALPASLRLDAKKWKNGRFYRVKAISDMYLILLPDGSSVEPGLRNLCAVVAPKIPLKSTFDEVVKEIGGVPLQYGPGFAIGFRHVNLEQNYIFTAGGFTQEGWGGPFASRYKMLRLARMEPGYVASLRQSIIESRKKN